MPKWPVRAENSVPEAQTLCVERFLGDLFNAPCHGSVCGGGRHQIGQPTFSEKKSEKTKVGQNHPKISVVKSVCRQTDGKAVNRKVVGAGWVGGGHMCV